jgi:nucleoside 2-deoxyribosyltransferase
VPRVPRVFLAAPYSQWMDPLSGCVLPLWRDRLDSLRRALMGRGAEVFSAHHNEAWGAQWLAAHLCTPVDFAAMKRADVVCAVVGAPASGGVAVELGWASALGKPVMLVVPPGDGCSPLILGLGTVTRTESADEPDEWRDDDVVRLAERTLAMVDGKLLDEPKDGDPGGPDDLARHVAFCSRESCRHATSIAWAIENTRDFVA